MVRIAALCTLAGAAALSVSRAPLEAPLLSSPVYSLATLNGDDSTNMNICTYATPVGIRPQRRWTLSLYRGTRSHANFAARRRGVLQLLREAHAPATHAGGVSGRESAPSARRACEALGLEWETCGDWDERVLPGCAAYLRLVAVDGSVDCGDHEVFICRRSRASATPQPPHDRRAPAAGAHHGEGAAVEPAAAFAPAPAAAFHQPAFAPPKPPPRYANRANHCAGHRNLSKPSGRPPPGRRGGSAAAEASSDSDVVDVEFAGAQTNGVAAAKLQDLPDDDDDLKGFLLEALKAVAKAKGVDAVRVLEKADLVAAIRAAPAAAEPSNSTASGLDLGAGDYDGVLNYENVAVRRLTKQMVAGVLQAANHYDVLGVEVEAGDRDVKVAYATSRCSCTRTSGADGAAEAFQKINEANALVAVQAMPRIALLLCTLTGAAALAAPVSRAPLEAPLLDAPVYSLATLNGDGSSNMNIVTYASPVGIRPERRWTLSLYRGTRSHANFAARRRGVLQLLREAQRWRRTPAGRVGGEDDAVDKAAAKRRRRHCGPAAVAPRRGRGGLRGGRRGGAAGGVRRRAAAARRVPAETNALYSTRTCLKYGRDKDGRLRSCLPSENCVSTSAVKSPAQFSPPWAYTPTTSDAKVAFAELGGRAVDKDDVEFVVDEKKSFVFYRSASRESIFFFPAQNLYSVPLGDDGTNQARLERTQARLGEHGRALRDVDDDPASYQPCGGERN
ncbi:hypothetical protein JL721_12873 [Aureococcus anophagefferens]|nr:hypothetical protein JL721_12873 [Aureococcus anophagefferens]